MKVSEAKGTYMYNSAVPGKIQNALILVQKTRGKKIELLPPYFIKKKT